MGQNAYGLWQPSGGMRRSLGGHICQGPSTSHVILSQCVSLLLLNDFHLHQDRILNYGSLGNYSLAGFEMILHRYVSHYIITYYLPSGKTRAQERGTHGYKVII